MLRFDPSVPSAPPKAAATVVVIRDADAGVELFCVKRHARSGFLGGAVVFPGGKVDGADGAEAWESLTTSLSERAESFGASQAEARTFAVAALRETLEEAAILPLEGDPLDAEGTLGLRAELERRVAEQPSQALAFAELLRERGLCLDTARLEALSRWVTPEAEPRRYDTRFYLLPLPPGQLGQHDQRETTSSFWAAPSEVLARSERGEIFLAPPTLRTVELFTAARDVAGALELARAQSLEPLCPHFVTGAEPLTLALPGDPLYPTPHPPPADPSAPTRFVLEAGRFVPRRVTG